MKRLMLFIIIMGLVCLGARDTLLRSNAQQKDHSATGITKKRALLPSQDETFATYPFPGNGVHAASGNVSAPADLAAIAGLVPIQDIKEVAAGKTHTCILTTAGGVKCWGNNGFGQLGDGTTDNRLTPVNVVGLTSGVTAINAGDEHTCALTLVGGVKCWGRNQFGQLGDGTTVDKTIPVDVIGLASGVIAVSAGGNHTCALVTSGAVRCWGRNVVGQLGDGTTVDKSIPVPVVGLDEIVALSLGFAHSCALTTNGGVKCWGRNDSGQLGDGTTQNRLMPVDVIGLSSGVAAISAGNYYTCALFTAGGVKCWGRNDYGQLGDGTTQNKPIPGDGVGLANAVTAISAGSSHTCALTIAGGIKCWGANYAGQLGDGTTVHRTTPVDVIELADEVIAVSAGDSHTCALTTARGVKCWGWNRIGQLGDGTTANKSVPVDVVGLMDGVAALSAGGYHTCALTTTGGARCWGHNSFGQLGDGTTAWKSIPADMVGPTSEIATISIGSYHTCALTTAGGVRCWGANDRGQLGDGTTENKTMPVDVVGLSSGVVAISTGNDHTCALTTTGSVRCWGANDRGQLGDGTTVDRWTPVNVSGLASGVAAIGAGGSHTCALTTTGGVKCWGANNSGQLGDGTNVDKRTPVNVSGLASGVAAIGAGGSHTCALTTTGGVKCWGANSSGQLGDGTSRWKSSPVDVIGLSRGVAAISTGGSHTCALTVSGGVKCWGANDSGQLGDDTNVNRATPVDVIGLPAVSAIRTGLAHTCALTIAGGVKCWGSNRYGQLGDGKAWRTRPGDVLTDGCYLLTRTHTGNGGDPTASPQRVLTCPTGYYTVGTNVMLTAMPAAGWRVAGWSGTVNDASTATTNYLTMPANDTTVVVHYEQFATPTPTLTPTPIATNTPTPTLTQSPIPNTPTPTATRPAGGQGDPYEPDDTCALARFIPADGTVQNHTFHQPADQDWVAFQAIAGQRYLILGDVPAGSPADLVLVPYRACDAVPDPGQDYTFSPGVRLQFQAQATGPVYLKWMNHSPSVAGPHVRYAVSVRTLRETAEPGVLILVAGRIRENDPLQPRIYAVTDAVRRLFLAHGYTEERIFYLAPDFRPGVDATASAANLRAAIVTWARERVGPGQPLSLYLMDHGAQDRFYLDRPRGESVTPADLDAWLAQLETARPGVPVNVILEACYAGSFIEPPQNISRPGRVVIASTGATNVAYASASGAVFSDHFLAALEQGESLYGSFRNANRAVQTIYLDQTPWLDDNGNGVANEATDGAEAQRRGFSYAGTLSDEKWPPYIAEVIAPATLQGGSGEIRARVLDDPETWVRRVWIVVYPPSYRPPASSEELVTESLPGAVLQDRGGGWYGVTYTGFTERGMYRVVVHAEDSSGLQAQPVMVMVGTGPRVYLPLMIR